MRNIGGTTGMAAMLVTLSALSGCSSATPLPAADLARVNAEGQVVVAHQPPRLPLSVFTKETVKAERIGGFFGIAGLATGAAKSMSDAQKLGAQLVGAYGLTDPVATVEERFISVAASRGMGSMQAVAEPVPSADASDLKPRFGESTVIVLKTVAWMLSFGKDERRFVTVYAAEASLVRGREAAVVWGAKCPVQPPGFVDPSTLPTLDELTANNGELLRARFAERATACADYLLGLFFGSQ